MVQFCGPCPLTCSENVPREQRRHEVEPGVSAYEPESHCVHCGAPTVDEKEPLGQAVHGITLAAANWPAAHCV